MATLDYLKNALRQNTDAAASFEQHEELSHLQYSSGFNTLKQGAAWRTYEDFVIPQLSRLMSTLLESRCQVSVLEIGPGPQSVFEHLPIYLRRTITRYDAFEPNRVFHAELEERLSTSAAESPLPCLEAAAAVNRAPFIASSSDNDIRDDGKGYDIILFCHSMYGMNPKRTFIERALNLLSEHPIGGIVAVFHRDSLHVDRLVCHRAVPFPTGVVRVANNDQDLDCFSAFIAGYAPQDGNTGTKDIWRGVCRSLGRCEEAYPGQLLFTSPEIMVAFTRNGNSLRRLTAHVPVIPETRMIKNKEACLRQSAPIVRPANIQQVQQCVQWALNHRCSLTVLSGGHSAHCLWPNVVCVDMAAFDQVHILTGAANGQESNLASASLIAAGTGCTAGEVIRKSMAVGLTVPLGSRPSVGAGLWLQGGIGHLSRLYGLTCDAIVGAVMVSTVSGRILYIGQVPCEHRPAGAVRPKNEAELLWAIKGAGTNFGIVVSVVFAAYKAPRISVRKWIKSFSNRTEAQARILEFGDIVTELDRNCSADAYLYKDNGNLQLGIATFESITPAFHIGPSTPTSFDVNWGPEDEAETVDCDGLFSTDMYVSKMHGGHAAGKTSSFKRCLFLKDLKESCVIDRLVSAVDSAPAALCYFHLLHGGGAVKDIAPHVSAFGCRDWEYACVITGVWSREDKDPQIAQSVVQWVYHVVEKLLPFSSGAYSADLGPDPRDAALASAAFGPHASRLAYLKRSLDPYNVLAHACPLPPKPVQQKLIVLVTGDSCAGKDYCAETWASVFFRCLNLTARVVSISEVTKKEYAAASGADLSRLLQDRAYKERHRPALTSFFREQIANRPELLTEHFLQVVHGAEDWDVLLITGMRDEAPVASLSHLVPDKKLIEVQVQASENVRLTRRGDDPTDTAVDMATGSKSIVMDYRPDFTFTNDTNGSQGPEEFAERCLIPFFDKDIGRLADMVQLVPDFPRPGIQLRHVLGVSQQRGGLALCTMLLRTHFTGTWDKVDAIACCEAGGFIYASALAVQVDVPLALVREAGKLPPPTISVSKPASYVSSLTSKTSIEKRFEMEKGAISRGASVVVVDDVLSTGKTLCAMLELLREAGADAENIRVMVLIEFPVHRGRERLRRCGFGKAYVQSLLVVGSV